MSHDVLDSWCSSQTASSVPLAHPTGVAQKVERPLPHVCLWHWNWLGHIAPVLHRMAVFCRWTQFLTRCLGLACLLPHHAPFHRGLFLRQKGCATRCNRLPWTDADMCIAKPFRLCLRCFGHQIGCINTCHFGLTLRRFPCPCQPLFVFSPRWLTGSSSALSSRCIRLSLVDHPSHYLRSKTPSFEKGFLRGIGPTWPTRWHLQSDATLLC